MNKRELSKALRVMIEKENSSHQEAFNHYKSEFAGNLDVLAERVSLSPSKNRIKKYQTIVNVYILLLAIFALMRLAGILLYSGIGGPSILASLAAVALPVVGIVMALKNQVFQYRIVGVFLILAVVKMLRFLETSGPFDFIFSALPIIAATVLAFILHSKLKTPFQKVAASHENGGFEYIFEKDLESADDPLDAGI